MGDWEGPFNSRNSRMPRCHPPSPYWETVRQVRSQEWQEAPALLEEGRVSTTGNRALEMQSWVASLCRMLGCLPVYQNSRCFISRKGTSAAGVSEVKEGPDYSITGIMGTRRQDHPTLGLEQGVAGQRWLGSEQGGLHPQWQCPSGLGKWRQAPVLGKEAELRLAGLPLPAGGEAGWQCQEGVVGRQGLRWFCCH